MDKQRWAKQSSQVLGGRNITVTTEFLHPDYNKPVASIAEKTSDTGQLALFKIEPRQPNSLPTFVARWDHRQACLDIDLNGDTEERRSFKAGKTGYRGHKTELVMEEGRPRTFVIDIEAPRTGKVFRGTVSLSIDWAMNLEAGLYVTAGFEASAQIVRPKTSGEKKTTNT